MDVTSMLNNSMSAAAAVQPMPAEAVKPPVRNRTPWDAGGYALPIMSLQNPDDSQQRQSMADGPTSLQEPVERQHQIESIESTLKSSKIRQPDIYESNLETPASFGDDGPPQGSPVESSKYSQNDAFPSRRHYLSDSRSSLSSFASSLSLNSATHSRFSSTSTVSGYHALNTITDESDSEIKQRSGRWGPSGVRSPLMFSPVGAHPRSQSVASAIEPLSTLALIAERRSQEDLSLENVATEVIGIGKGIDSLDKSKVLDLKFRSRSPSDALMIKRTGLRELRDPSPSRERKRRLYNPEGKLMELAESSSQRLNIPRPPHKRTLSAPDFKDHLLKTERPVSSLSRPSGPRSEPTPPSSIHPDQTSPDPSQYGARPESPPEISQQRMIPEPRCMYIEDCDTNSTPRKAISHLLGRNKMCTRLIPAHIWVQYCRKHYQRARYRNMGGWPPLQCELVQEQIKRLEVWSNENVKRGEGPVVKDWTLALRKREQSRRDRMAKSAAKRAFGDVKDDSDVEMEDVSVARGDRSDNPPQAVPEWLFGMVGSGYSNSEISSIFQRIHGAILDKELPNMPDIEILPNIIVDPETTTPKESKGYVKRKAVGGAHQRSRSLGGAALRGNEGWANARRSSQPIMWETGIYAGGPVPPVQKRKRFEDFEEEGSFPPSMIPTNQRLRLNSYDGMQDGRRLNQPRIQPFWVDTSHPHQQHVHASQEHVQNQYRQVYGTGDGGIPARGGYYQQNPQHMQQQQHHQTQHQQPHYPQQHLQQGHPHGHAHSLSMSGQITYASPMVAPQPLRQPYMSTAQQLDTDSGNLNSTGIGMRKSVHQRSRSDVSYLRRHDSHPGYTMHQQQHGSFQGQQRMGEMREERPEEIIGQQWGDGGFRR